MGELYLVSFQNQLRESKQSNEVGAAAVENVEEKNQFKKPSVLIRSPCVSSGSSRQSEYANHHNTWQNAGINPKQLQQLLQAKDKIVQELSSFNGSLTKYCHRSTLCRLLAFSRIRFIQDIYTELWEELCRCVTRNMQTLWCFQTRHEPKPMSQTLIYSLSQRYSVCMYAV